MKLGEALTRYSLANSDVYPATLDELYPDYVSTKELFLCPAYVDEHGKGADARYRFPAAGKAYSSRADSVLLMCPVAHRTGGSVLYADGRVAWLPTEKFYELAKLQDNTQKRP